MKKRDIAILKLFSWKFELYIEYETSTIFCISYKNKELFFEKYSDRYLMTSVVPDINIDLWNLKEGTIFDMIYQGLKELLSWRKL